MPGPIKRLGRPAWIRRKGWACVPAPFFRFAARRMRCRPQTNWAGICVPALFSPGARMAPPEGPHLGGCACNHAWHSAGLPARCVCSHAWYSVARRLVTPSTTPATTPSTAPGAISLRLQPHLAPRQVPSRCACNHARHRVRRQLVAPATPPGTASGTGSLRLQPRLAPRREPARCACNHAWHRAGRELVVPATTIAERRDQGALRLRSEGRVSRPSRQCMTGSRPAPKSVVLSWSSYPMIRRPMPRECPSRCA
jgi:hypothetical protein